MTLPAFAGKVPTTLMLTKHTANDLVSLLQMKGYAVPLRLQLIMDNSLKGIDGKPMGDGSNILDELEIDRRNVFRTYYGQREWKNMLTVAHEMYCDKDRITHTVELLLKDLDEKAAKEEK